jgi:uncharacterized protein (DUF302 family)
VKIRRLPFCASLGNSPAQLFPWALFGLAFIIGEWRVRSGGIEMKMSSVWFAATLASLVLGLSITSKAGTGESAPTRAVTVSSVTHVNFESSKSYDIVTAAIEKQLGKFDAKAFDAAMKDVSNPAGVEAKVHAMEGSSGFMLFDVRDHGQLLSLKGRKAFGRQYEIGNPLIAVEMTKVDLRAGEYAPLRLCVYVGEDQMTHIDYDLPSTVFGRLKSDEIDKVARDLDRKMDALIANALKD